MATGDIPNPWTSISVCSTAAVVPNISYTPTVTVGTSSPCVQTGTLVDNSTYVYPYGGGTSYPFTQPNQWMSTSSFWTTDPEWTHRIWYCEKYTYYMQTSNDKEDILMNRRKITQGCTLT